MRLNSLKPAPGSKHARHRVGRGIGSGWGKTAWILFVILLPFLGVFVYLITQNVGMTERKLQRSRAERDGFDEYVRATGGNGGGAAAEIESAKRLLDSGAITHAEFDALKGRALA